MSLLVVLMMVFLLAEAGKLPAKLEGALGWSRRDLDRMAKAQREVQSYLVYKTLISALTGVLVAGWVSILGVSFPLLWGLIAFLLNYIPNLGSIIAALPPMLLTLIDQGPGTALLVGLGYLVVNLVSAAFSSRISWDDDWGSRPSSSSSPWSSGDGCGDRSGCCCRCR